MSYPWLPDEDNTPTLRPQGGGGVSVNKTVFYDDYTNHFDAHKVFSTPPKISEFNLKENFDVADSVFSDEQLKYRIEESDWFGDDTDYEKLINGYTSFQDPELLIDVVDQIDSEIPKSLFSGIEKPKMNINDRFGIFSFDLASMAMTYIYDYFDSEGEKVDSNFVHKTKGKFYDLKTKKEVTQRIRKREDGTDVVISSVRKCMIDFEKTASQDRAVEIFINSSFSADISPKKIIYNSMAGVAVAKNLTEKGFKVKITAVLGAYNGIVERDYFHFIPVKRYDQTLDINAIAYVCGDARFFRYQGFKLYISGYDRDFKISPSGIGSPLNNLQNIARKIETEYIPNSEKTPADTRLYFGGSRSLKETKKEVERALEILNNKYGKDED
jgi:hypothetical protein